MSHKESIFWNPYPNSRWEPGGWRGYHLSIKYMLSFPDSATWHLVNFTFQWLLITRANASLITADHQKKELALKHWQHGLQNQQKHKSFSNIPWISNNTKSFQKQKIHHSLIQKLSMLKSYLKYCFLGQVSEMQSFSYLNVVGMSCWINKYSTVTFLYSFVLKQAWPWSCLTQIFIIFYCVVDDKNQL